MGHLKLATRPTRLLLTGGKHQISNELVETSSQRTGERLWLTVGPEAPCRASLGAPPRPALRGQLKQCDPRLANQLSHGALLLSIILRADRWLTILAAVPARSRPVGAGRGCASHALAPCSQSKPAVYFVRETIV